MGAAYAPLLQMTFVNGYMKQKAPPVFDLISTRFCFFSCDKWAQVDRCPMACGIYITKTKFQLHPPEKTQITYFDSPGLTLTGSRNAHSVLVLWSYISTYSYDEQAKMAVEACSLVQTTQQQYFKEIRSFWSLVVR